MTFQSLHSWQVTAQEAIALQASLRDQVIREARFGEIKTVAGIDVGFEQGGTITRAAVVVLGYPGLETVATSIVRRPTTFP